MAYASGDTLPTFLVSFCFFELQKEAVAKTPGWESHVRAGVQSALEWSLSQQFHWSITPDNQNTIGPLNRPTHVRSQLTNHSPTVTQTGPKTHIFYLLVHTRTSNMTDHEHFDVIIVSTPRDEWRVRVDVIFGVFNSLRSRSMRFFVFVLLCKISIAWCAFA